MQNYSGGYLSAAHYPQHNIALNSQNPLIPTYNNNNYSGHLAPSLVHYEQYTFFHPPPPPPPPPSTTNSSTTMANPFPFRKRINLGYADLSEQSENEITKSQKMSLSTYNSMYHNGHGFYSMDNNATSASLSAYSNPNLFFKSEEEQQLANAYELASYEYGAIPFSLQGLNSSTTTPASNIQFLASSTSSNISSRSEWFSTTTDPQINPIIATTSTTTEVVKKQRATTKKRQKVAKVAKQRVTNKIYFEKNELDNLNSNLIPNLSAQDEKMPIACQWVTGTTVCNEIFHSLSGIVSHLSNHHVNALTHQICYWRNCARKEMEFKARYKLINHLRVHTGEKPYNCRICSKMFSRTENLKIHERTHTGEKPFKCDLCEKYFANSSDRKKHMHVHSNSRSYECTEAGCNKTYTHPSSLRKHVKNHQKGGKMEESILPELPEDEDELDENLDESRDSGHASAETSNSLMTTIDNNNIVGFLGSNPHSNSNCEEIFGEARGGGFKPIQIYHPETILLSKKSMLNFNGNFQTNEMLNSLNGFSYSPTNSNNPGLIGYQR